MSDLEGKVKELAAKQAATDKKLAEQGKAVADLQRQLSKRCLIVHGPDVPAKQLGETEANTLELFFKIANQGFKTIVSSHEIAACHRQGKVTKYTIYVRTFFPFKLSFGLVRLTCKCPILGRSSPYHSDKDLISAYF